MDRAPHTPSPPQRRADPKLSKLAVAALILALLPLCPPVNLLGAIMGLLAHRRILVAQGRLRGMGLARAAIVAGITLSLLASILLGRLLEAYRTQFEGEMVSTIEQVIEASIEDRPAEVSARWTAAGSPVPSLDEIERFGGELARRYGRARRVSIVAFTQTGILAPEVQAAVIFHFDTAELNGSVELELVMGQLQLTPSFRIRSILVADPERGDLGLPAEPAGD